MNDKQRKAMFAQKAKSDITALDIIKSQYKLQGSCKICGRVNRPYTIDNLNGHDEHRHRFQRMLK